MCLDSLHGQVTEAGAEVIVADSTGQGLPEDTARRYPEVAWLKVPGASVFQLRALAMSRSRAEVVAITEDHCRVAPDWCERILAAHKEHPDAAAIGGSVENGAAERVIDWASFFIVNGASMPPIAEGARKKVSLQANLTYKRRVIPADVPKLGRMEWMFNQELRRRGEKLIADGRIRVEHVQSFTFREACSIHYHDGRAIAGFRLEKIGAMERLVRLGACFIMPPALFLRTVLPILHKRRFLGWLSLSLPMIAVLVHCRAAGAFVGFLFGAGESPQHIR
jgi:hypothetical protein